MDHKTYQPAADALKDRIILITGAGDGIGKTVALGCARYGATVVLLGRQQKKLEAVYDEIVAAGGAQPAIVPMNLLTITPDDTVGLANTLLSEFGRLDGLLHNAAVLGERAPIEHYSPNVWLEVMQINVNAAFLLTQSLMPLLKAAYDPSVVFTTSGVGRKGKAFWGAYAVSKFATEGMMQVLADELDESSRIRVNCINPGGTRTKMRAAAFPAEDTTKLKTPQDILPTYLWLLGPDSHAIHGQSVDAQ
ncbi:YciK family oxidoreductase [Permianibacter sp. IMCC34836]|uniref:YciK family oxidoreductase n=1 Tax=Permianibacter fluminis TaxID=2738515 RepID=UPI0015578B9D|nr:YciK family oxidoreductase [Permianibacter fluminis]NQD37381.1 YciK family oxidoreductase [Permianibacter fluminis]